MRRADPAPRPGDAELIPMIDADTSAFNDYMAALALPSDTPERGAARRVAMQDGLRRAVEVPLLHHAHRRRLLGRDAGHGRARQPRVAVRSRGRRRALSRPASGAPTATSSSTSPTSRTRAPGPAEAESRDRGRARRSPGGAHRDRQGRALGVAPALLPAPRSKTPARVPRPARGRSGRSPEQLLAVGVRAGRVAPRGDAGLGALRELPVLPVREVPELDRRLADRSPASRSRRDGSASRATTSVRSTARGHSVSVSM